jgi:DNA end-binding protein Ku
VEKKEMAMAASLVESLSDDFDPSKYHDEYRDEVMALIQAKADGQELEVPAEAAEKPNVVDIMAALEASVAAAKKARADEGESSGKRSRTSAAKKSA